MLCYANLYLRTNPLKIFKDAPRTNFSTEQKIFIPVVLKFIPGHSLKLRTLRLFKGFTEKTNLTGTHHLFIHEKTNPLKTFKEPPVVFFSTEQKIYFPVVLKFVPGHSLNLRALAQRF